MNRAIFTLLAASAFVTGCSEQSADAPAPASSASASAPAMTDASGTPAQEAYRAVNDEMHMAMGNVPADPDLAYMQGMLAHHRGAIRMSNVVMQYGKDTATKDLARRVIAAQAKEVEEIERWLAANGHSSAPTGTATASAMEHTEH